MAENTSMDYENRAVGPTYKSLFLVACGIIGGVGEWWFTGFMDDYRALASRVAVLEIRDVENRWTFKINSEKIDKLERIVHSQK